MLPVDDFRRALADAMEREPTVALSYSTGGHPGLRRWIGERYGVPGERVVCANGSLEVFAFVASVLLARASTPRVLVEAPTYDRSILILQRAGADVVGVPVDGDGIDTDALAAELEREPPAFLYVIPNFQNPSGATMSLERRRRVLELAAAARRRRRRGRPLRPPALGGRDAPDALRARRRRPRAHALLVHEDRRPGPAHRLRRRSRGAGARRSASTPRTPTSRPAWSRRPDSPPTARPAPSSPASSAPSRSSRRAATRWSSPCARTSRPTRRWSCRRAATSSGSTWGRGRHHRARRARRRGRRPVRQGRRLLRRRRRHDVPAPGLLRGAAPIASARASSASARSSPRDSRASSRCRLTISSRATARGRRACSSATPGFFRRLEALAGAALSLDRLLGQPRARQRDHRHRSGRGLRPPQRRQRRRAHRPQLPVGHAVRRRGARGRGDRGLRPSRLRRRRGRARRPAARPDRQLAAPRAGRRARARARCWRRRPRTSAPTCSAGSTWWSRSRTSAARRSCRRRGAAGSAWPCTASSTASPTACCAISGSARARPDEVDARRGEAVARLAGGLAES